ncbi:sensor histidine kinase [Piscinibacter sakaiensis]|uniref:sensor histidine kinase n=1 Tax=Piscinibacter sakaiensis TaxID=1547922 RepID=UPI003AAE862C
MSRWQTFSAAAVRSFRAYAGWLVGISWKRFVVLALLLIIAVEVISELPPFTWTIHEQVEITTPRPKKKIVDKPAKPPVGYEVTIDDHGVRITPKQPAAPASAASAASSTPARPGRPTAPEPPPPPPLPPSAPSFQFKLPKGTDTDEVRQAIEDARRDIEQAIADARQAAADAAEVVAESSVPNRRVRVTRLKLGDFLNNLAWLFVIASAIIKFAYKGRIQAETKAAQATETAESEALKRQVVEARMAAMQAQVEPHFLFNTLASIDHLIETDPKRASQMQKNLIALLRASMPSMRDVNGGSTNPRDLGRELAVIRPYLEILKVRMEERLSTEIRVSDGLLSAEFPPMMLQSLVENAIKHGLEPKADGGRLTVSAEIVHGKLAVTVADTGLGFGKSATAGTGIGLSNIRERLQLLYGSKAALKIAENPGGGTAVTITVPYQSTSETGAST